MGKNDFYSKNVFGNHLKILISLTRLKECPYPGKIVKKYTLGKPKCCFNGYLGSYTEVVTSGKLMVY